MQTDPPSFPPAPWSLTGELTLTLWLSVQRAPVQLPQDIMPPGPMPVWATVWARYGPDGDLSYNELLCGMIV